MRTEAPASTGPTIHPEPRSGQVEPVRRGLARAQHLLAHLAPWLVLAGMLLWGWRTDLLHGLPAYGDVLEGTWAIAWYAQALRLGQNPLIYPLAFHPAGYQVFTYAWGLATFLLLLPFNAIGGPAFAYNIATLTSFVIAFAGMRLLARRFLGPLAAAVGALLYTFFALRWYNNVGQLNIALGSALLPWLLWSLERGLTDTRRWRDWCLLAGVLWAAAIYSSLYFIWIGAFALAGWSLGRLASQATSRRNVLSRLARIVVAASVLSLPGLVLFRQASLTAGTAAFNLPDVNELGASLNSLPVPSLNNPALSALAQSIYHGSPDGEADSANLGLLTCLVALGGTFAVGWRSERWRPVLITGCLGLVLSLGLTLRWDGSSLQWAAWRPVDQLLWQAGRLFKPGLFHDASPPGPLDAAIPLPDLLLTATVPFFDGARAFVRYGLLAGLAVFLLAGLGLEQVRQKGLRLGLAALLVLEVLPAPTATWPFPLTPHPAFAWLHEQNESPQGIIELYAGDDFRMVQPTGGKTIWATVYHGQATTSGMSSFLPDGFSFIKYWLAMHAHPFQSPEFVPLLRAFQVRYAMLHMYGGWPDQAFAEAKANPELRDAHCFPEGPEPPWTYPICILEVAPELAPDLNLMFQAGWSGLEEWGRWIDGTRGQAQWFAATKAPQRLSVQAFPATQAGLQQQVWLAVNGRQLAEYQWTKDEPWSAEIVVPTDLVRVGYNDLTVRTGYAAPPTDQDTRRLSVGFTRLRIDPWPASK